VNLNLIEIARTSPKHVGKSGLLTGEAEVEVEDNYRQITPERSPRDYLAIVFHYLIDLQFLTNCETFRRMKYYMYHDIQNP
jgi:hypothetical protein